MVLVVVMAGCAALPDPPVEAFPLDVYVFAPAGSWFGAHAVMARVTNPTDGGVAYEVEVDLQRGRVGPVDATGWQEGAADTLGPGESRLWLLDFQEVTGHTFRLRIDAAGGSYEWNQTLPNAGGPPVEAGMHVLTYTVGVWINGTSFYTNIASLNEDAAFPAGYDRSAFGGAPLPVYVYDQDRSEQPARSIDTCHFTTIPGYNALLKTQSEGGTGVRFLAPEDGYTRAGNEEHFLYGDALVFLNTVIAIEPRDERLDDVPDPQGDCFDVNRYTPDPVPDVPPALLP